MLVTRQGALLERLTIDGAGMAYSDVSQPSRSLVLEQTRKLREERVIEHRPSMGVELCIPEIDFWAMVRANPDYASHDGEIKRKAWLKFIGSPESRPYRLHERGGAKARSRGGISNDR